MKLTPLLETHFADVARIYREGIATGQATFETRVPQWNDWDKSHLPACRIIASDGGQVAGWAALTPVSSRCVYAGVAEVSVYVAADHRNKGVGSLLLEGLINSS